MKEKTEREKLRIIRHIALHFLAFAAQKVFKDKIKLGTGAVLEEGFYYDFFVPFSFKPKDIEDIEKEFFGLLKKAKNLKNREVSLKEAKKLFVKEPFKLEVIEEFINGATDEFGIWQGREKQEKIPLVELDSYIDLCSGLDFNFLKFINPSAAKILSFSGVYWRGDNKRESMQRIYGTIWFKKEDLEIFLKNIEEAKKRDHRKIGKEQELFLISSDIGLGLPLWLPKGAVIRREIDNFIYEEQTKRGYQFVYTPHIGKKSLWEISGHWNLYKDKMFAPMIMEDGDYLVKPMSCPMHMIMFRSAPRSYKDLPLRFAENATVYRREQTGELSGLVRVRSITQDDAHIFLRPDQLKEEFSLVLENALYELNTFGFKDFEMWVAVRDPRNKEKYLGSDEIWEEAELAIVEALKKAKISFIRAEGEAKFYGPALDVMLRDSIGRQWQCTTLQVDFMLPERFGLEYVDKNNKKKRPVVLHRAFLGSMERFIGILIEHYAGVFPLWLAPIQVVVIPLSDKFNDYSREITEQLKNYNIRVSLDNRKESVQYRIREAVLQKIPYLLVIGEKEFVSKRVSVRKRGGNKVEVMKLSDFYEVLREEIKLKKI